LDRKPWTARLRSEVLRLCNWHQNCIDFDGRRVQGKREKDTPMGISAILIATAISLTMLVMVSDLP
jgi:hypothetical protein